MNADEFLSQYLGLAEGVQTKRQHKQSSGRASFKQKRSYESLGAVGGMSSNLKASLAPEGTKLCRVVTREVVGVNISTRPINNNVNPNSVCYGVEGTAS